MSPPGEQAITTLDGTDEAEDGSPKSEGLVGQALQVASKLLDLRNPLRSGIEPTGRCERVPNLHRVVSSGLEPRPEGGVTGTYPVLRSSSSGPTWLQAPVSSSPRRNERPVDHVRLSMLSAVGCSGRLPPAGVGLRARRVRCCRG
jgi:hypothetical protein